MHSQIISSLIAVPRAAGGGKIAQLRLCAGYPSGKAREHPEGDAVE